MARPKEGINTTYVPVINASHIAIMAHKMNMKARTRSFLGLMFFERNGINRWMKTAELDNTMDIVSVITNALKAAFLLRSTEPGCEPSPPPTNPPGMVIDAAKVTVAMSVATTNWTLVSCTINLLSLFSLSFFFLSSLFLSVSSLSALSLSLFLSLSALSLSLFIFSQSSLSVISTS